MCSKAMAENALKPKINKLKPGQQRKPTVQTDRHIKKMSQADPFLSAKDIKEGICLNVSARTANRRLVEQNLLARSARKVSLLSRKSI